MASFAATGAAAAIPASAAPASHLISGRHDGLVVTDLEVVTVPPPTSVTFCWATYDGPHPAYGRLDPTVPTTAEVRLAPDSDPSAGYEAFRECS